MNKKRKCLKGFAFVTYTSKHAYQTVLELKQHQIRGKIMIARAALKENDASHISKILQSQKLYIRGFPPNTTEESIEGFFGAFGKVNRVLMCFDKYRNFRGFAYVVMESMEGYDAVLRNSARLEFLGHRLFVSSSKTQKELNLLRKEQEASLRMFAPEESEVVREYGYEQQRERMPPHPDPQRIPDQRVAEERPQADASSQQNRYGEPQGDRERQVDRSSLFSQDREEGTQKLPSSRIPGFFREKQKSSLSTAGFSGFYANSRVSGGFSVLEKYCSKNLKPSRRGRRIASEDYLKQQRTGQELIKQHSLIFKAGAGYSAFMTGPALSPSSSFNSRGPAPGSRQSNSYGGASPLLDALMGSPACYGQNTHCVLNNNRTGEREIEKAAERMDEDNYCFRVQEQPREAVNRRLALSSRMC